MNILTFDIEDWYCHDNYTQNFDWHQYEVRIYEPMARILDFLDENDVKATFFCLGWLAENHPSIIKDIVAHGHQLGCHSYQHQLAYRFNKMEFYDDTYKSKKMLEDLSGLPVNAYRAPSYSITPQNPYAFDVLAELGFTHDCSIFPTSRECGGFEGFGDSIPSLIKHNDHVIKEFPMNIYKLLGKKMIFSGGGYFRILPYDLIRYCTNNSNYIMSYFHPSDFDPKQPKMKHLTFMRQLKNEIGLNGAFCKFKKYIRDNEFMTVEDADKIIDWDKVNIFEIN